MAVRWGRVSPPPVCLRLRQLLQPRSSCHFRSKMAAALVLRTWSRTAGQLVSRLGPSGVGTEWFIWSCLGEMIWFFLRVPRVQGSRDGEVEGCMQNEGQRRWRTNLSGNPLSRSIPRRPSIVTRSPPASFAPQSPAGFSPNGFSLSTIWVPGIVFGTGDTEMYYIRQIFIEHHFVSELIIRPLSSRNLQSRGRDWARKP